MSTHIIHLAIAGFALAAFEAIMRGPGGHYRLVTVAVVVAAFAMPPVPGGGLVLAIVVPLAARRVSRLILAVIIPRRAKKLAEAAEPGDATVA